MHTCDDIVMVVSLYQQTNLESKFTSDRAKVQVALRESRPMVIKLLCRWPPSQSVLSSLTPVDDMYATNGTETHEANRKSHKEEGTKRRQLEAADRQRMRTELQKYYHPLTSPSDHLYNISTGQVATADVNTHQTVELGTAMRDDFIASYPGRFHHTISSKVKTTQSMERKATVNSKPVYDLDAFFGRLLIVDQKRDISIADLFNYELAPVPVPPSLINDYGCLRKSDESPFLYGNWDQPSLHHLTQTYFLYMGTGACTTWFGQCLALLKTSPPASRPGLAHCHTKCMSYLIGMKSGMVLFSALMIR